MELWVRSQDKEKLVRPTNLKIDYENQLYVILSKCNYRYRLGYYKTKERALEVLDEIQNILRPKYILDSSSIKECGNSWVENGVIMQEYNANATIQELSTYVYEMPKE